MAARTHAHACVRVKCAKHGQRASRVVCKPGSLIAQVCDLKPGEFIHTLGDAHVYVNHVDALKEQLTREPRPFPTLTINPAVKDIDGFKFSDFELHNYNPHGKLAMHMAV